MNIFLPVRSCFSFNFLIMNKIKHTEQLEGSITEHPGNHNVDSANVAMLHVLFSAKPCQSKWQMSWSSTLNTSESPPKKGIFPPETITILLGWHPVHQESRHHSACPLYLNISLQLIFSNTLHFISMSPLFIQE